MFTTEDWLTSSAQIAMQCQSLYDYSLSLLNKSCYACALSCVHITANIFLDTTLELQNYYLTNASNIVLINAIEFHGIISYQKPMVASAWSVPSECNHQWAQRKFPVSQLAVSRVECRQSELVPLETALIIISWNRLASLPAEFGLSARINRMLSMILDITSSYEFH